MKSEQLQSINYKRTVSTIDAFTAELVRSFALILAQNIPTLTCQKEDIKTMCTCVSTDAS